MKPPTNPDRRNAMMTPERARYILANRLPGGDLRYAFFMPAYTGRLYDDGMTRTEYEAIRGLWVTLPGGASFYSALCEVAAGRLTCPPQRNDCGGGVAPESDA